MFTEEEPWRTLWLVVSGAVLCFALVWGGSEWEKRATPAPAPAAALPAPLVEPPPAASTTHPPLVELLKLVSAALVGMVVTAVHKRCHGEKPLPRSLEQAQILLCVAGAMIMIIIGNSLARAFGVAGAAGIVRFRTPVEDPKDTTVIFLLLGLGLSCGLGAFAVAGLGTVFLSVFLVVLDKFGEAKRRMILLSMTATGKEFPAEQVNRVLLASVDSYEQREVVAANEAVMKYQVTMEPNVSLTWLSQELMKAGLKSVVWGEPTKKEKGA